MKWLYISFPIVIITMGLVLFAIGSDHIHDVVLFLLFGSILVMALMPSIKALTKKSHFTIKIFIIVFLIITFGAIFFAFNIANLVRGNGPNASGQRKYEVIDILCLTFLIASFAVGFIWIIFMAIFMLVNSLNKNSGKSIWLDNKNIIVKLLFNNFMLIFASCVIALPWQVAYYDMTLTAVFFFSLSIIGFIPLAIKNIFYYTDHFLGYTN